jgi:hypothetical protein
MTRPKLKDHSADPGVPEALPRSLIRLRERLGVDQVDRLWIFPPSRRGRREQGLIAVSTYLEGEERRVMVTVSYNAEHTGQGVSVDTSFTQEGEAPPERFPGVMAGVVRRAGEGQGEAREVEICGSPEKFEELLEEFDMDFLEAPLP